MVKEKAEKAKKIAIQYGNEKAVATLLWDKAPTICSKIWESLPPGKPGHPGKGL